MLILTSSRENPTSSAPPSEHAAGRNPRRPHPRSRHRTSALIGEYETHRAEQNAFGKDRRKGTQGRKARLVAQGEGTGNPRRQRSKGSLRSENRRNEELVSSIENLIIDGVPTGGEETIT